LGNIEITNDDVTPNFFLKKFITCNGLTRMDGHGKKSAQWIQIDHGLQRSGGGSAVRGADAP
jgi:hypothetical protein